MIDRRPDINEYDLRYKSYIDLVPENNLIDVMSSQFKETISFLKSLPGEIHDYSYAPGKWTVRQMFGHVCDGERTFGYRVLCTGRNDDQEFKRIDGELYVQNAKFDQLLLSEIADEFEAIRKSNIILFKHFPAEAWDRKTIVTGASITVRALGYLMVAHERHHIGIIKKFYNPAL